jgi:hypothetical protein
MARRLSGDLSPPWFETRLTLAASQTGFHQKRNDHEMPKMQKYGPETHQN